MTLNEFRAWLDGFEAAMADAPTAEQWAKIKAKLGTVSMASPPILAKYDQWKRELSSGELVPYYSV